MNYPEQNAAATPKICRSPSKNKQGEKIKDTKNSNGHSDNLYEVYVIYLFKGVMLTHG